MVTCKYGNETADLKLLAIRFIRKSWILLAAMLAGGAVFGISYFIQNVIMASEPVYETYSMLYVDFIEGEDGKPKYYTFNTAGWSGFVKTDEILDKALLHLNTPVDKAELRNSVGASVDSDYRVIELIVSNAKAETALDMAHAMEQAFAEFAADMEEIEQIRIMTTADQAEQVLITVHTYRAVIWGAMIAAVIVLFIMLFCVVLDDSIYVPLTFERRYQIPMLGAITSKGESHSLELAANLAYLKKDALRLAVVGAGSVTKETEQVMKQAGKEVSVQIDLYSRLMQNPEQIEEVRAYDGLILDIPAGARNGKQIESILSLLEKHDCRIIAAVLSNADWLLLKTYYFGSKRGLI